MACHQSQALDPILAKRNLLRTDVRWWPTAGTAAAAVTVMAGPFAVVSPMSLTLLVLAGGILGLRAWWEAERPTEWLASPVVAALAALIAWGLISALWAARPGSAALLAVRLAGLCALGLAVFFAFTRLDKDARNAVEKASLCGFGGGIVLLAAGLAYAEITGDSLWGEFDEDPRTPLNNGAVVTSLLLWPVTAILVRRGRGLTAMVIAAGVLGVLSFLTSGAALLAAATGGAAFLAVRLVGDRGATALATLLALLIVAAPYVVDQVAHSGRAAEAASKLPTSAQHRLKMWAFAVERIGDKPILGWGLDGSRSIPQEERRLAPHIEIMPLHPHNAALQVRLELGLPGVLLFAALVFVVFRVVGQAAPTRFGGGILAAQATAYLTVGALSYGVWQNWWIGAAWIVAGLSRMAVQPGPIEPVESRG